MPHDRRIQGRPTALLLAFPCLLFCCLLAGGCQPQGRVTAVYKLDLRGTGLDEAAEAAEETASSSGVTLELLDFAGIEQLVGSHRGKVVVMDAWAMSCPPCVTEFPKLVALSQRFGKDQLACISLSFVYQGLGEPADKIGRVTAFLEKQGATFDNVLASEEADTLYRKFQLTSVPAVFVYDRTGDLRKRFDNETAQSEAEHFTYEDVERLVAQLVEEPSEGVSSGWPH